VLNAQISLCKYVRWVLWQFWWLAEEVVNGVASCRAVMQEKVGLVALGARNPFVLARGRVY